MTGLWKNNREKILLVLLILLQLAGVTWLQTTIRNGGDGLFTFLLANNPYEFNYVDYTWKYYPENNGWIDSRILTEQYTVMPYDRFDLASVYWHQRIDNHPILYYSLVHLISSFFPEQYSQMFSMVINTVFLLGIDLLIIGILEILYPGGRLYAAPSILLLSLLYCYQRLGDLPRMYMMLAFFCAWYLYLHAKTIASGEEGKRFLLPWFFCVLAGSLTHYYFYVFGFF
ncbi:MAG: hypothetical protein II800_04785, partial [Lachnospiraceae bacterium]|nr:hypothetical protein [Lachnospiraceae bacterium]